jgi:hypothetical protein
MSGPRNRGAGIVPAQLTASTLYAVLAGMIASESAAGNKSGAGARLETVHSGKAACLPRRETSRNVRRKPA